MGVFDAIRRGRATKLEKARTSAYEEAVRDGASEAEAEATAEEAAERAARRRRLLLFGS